MAATDYDVVTLAQLKEDSLSANVLFERIG